MIQFIFSADYSGYLLNFLSMMSFEKGDVYPFFFGLLFDEEAPAEERGLLVPAANGFFFLSLRKEPRVVEGLLLFSFGFDRIELLPDENRFPSASLRTNM
jgi:hypothetical protein